MPAKKKPASRTTTASARRDALRERLIEEAEPLARAAVGAVLDSRPADLIEPASTAVLARRVLESDALQPALRRHGRAALERELERLRALGTTPADLLPEASTARLRRAVGDPTIGGGEWVRKLAANDVLEQVMGTTLYEVLREFALTVNPFFSSWGLPALLKKAGPLGNFSLFGYNLNAGGRLLEGLRVEFETTLEPHLKTFLQKSARAALLRAVTLAQSEERLAAFAELRVRLFDEIHKTRFEALPLDRERLDRLEELLFGLLEDARGALLQDDLAMRVEALLERAGGRTVRELLAKAGLDPRALEDPAAAAYVPALRIMLGSEPVLEAMERVLLAVEGRPRPGAPKKKDD
jgi:hypothetical protein